MHQHQVHSAISKACKRVAPAWPLENFVAVNPYLGLADMTFQEAAQTMQRRGGIQLYMPLHFYLERIQKEELTHEDLQKAFTKNQSSFSATAFLKAAEKIEHKTVHQPTTPLFTELIAQVSEIDWSERMIDYLSAWCSAYFDKFQGDKTRYNQGKTLFSDWKRDAEIDLHPEIIGITSFRKNIAQVPNTDEEAIDFLTASLGLNAQQLEEYYHALLLKVIGWSSYCAGLDWNNGLYHGESQFTKSFLAVLLSWEFALLASAEVPLKDQWKERLQNETICEATEKNKEYLSFQAIFQDAFDIAFQRQLKHLFNGTTSSTPNTKARKTAQMVFCIDVRSEVYRRNIERIDPGVETLGFAGFFGFPLKYSPIAHEHGKNQCPVLIPSGPVVKEGAEQTSEVEKIRKQRFSKGSFQKAWTSFKGGAGSSFSFVSPLGMFFLPKLISDSFGWTAPIKAPKKNELEGVLSKGGQLDLSEIEMEDRITMALGALNAMGLTHNFAPLVLITGHGATSVNNPHASGLDCGACGGSSGEVNALTAALILNDSAVRAGLDKKGISIPDDTHFLACLHDTTTDEISILNTRNIPDTHTERYHVLSEKLKKASAATRQTRSARFQFLGKNKDAEIINRSKDWAQTRPEWGLAGCGSFIIAPRMRTQHLDLQSKAFLHSYEWKHDTEFNILETIMTAPMVVTSWINLQYYASTADNEKLGAGNKTLHNITGGMGVLEGARGDLRIGLPMQSIHDGKNYQHLPQRLNVIIEAPTTAINAILEKHPNVKALCDHGWIFLMTLNSDGNIDAQYEGNLNWESVEKKMKTSVEPEIIELVG